MIEELEQELKYIFKNKELLKKALIHKSYNEGVKKDLPNNEKLEFLGDSVINLVVTDYLYRNFASLNEGELSKLKAHFISSTFLFSIADALNLSQYLFLGKGEEKNDGRQNKKINASLFEAVVGAIYLDSNYRVVTGIIIDFFKKYLDRFSKKDIKINDYKSELQELIQRDKNVLPEYRIIQEDGKPPNVIFTASVYLENTSMGTGTGKNKRNAEQDAAYNALRNIDKFINYEKLSEVFFLKND